MRTLSRCLIPLLAAGCLAVTAGTSAMAVTASTATPATTVDAGAGAVAPAAPLPVPEPAPDPCAADWSALAGLTDNGTDTGTDTGTLREAIAACVESYTERPLDSWLQAPPKLPVEQMAQKEQGITAVEDWTGADAADADADWEDDLACDLAEIFDEPTMCRPAPANPAP